MPRSMRDGARPLRRDGAPQITSSRMAYIEFTDRAGRVWRVWHTRPLGAEIITTLPDDWKEGWLTFESGDEKRRLAPVPEGWERLRAERLELLCRVAKPTAPSARHQDVLKREEKRPE